MDKTFRYARINERSRQGTPTALYGVKAAEAVRGFHRSFPMYQPTPLVPLAELSAQLGLGGIYIKDESYRFGLNAFKVLGSSFAAGSYIASLLGVEIGALSYDMLRSAEVKARLGERTFVTATDGNHGRGVAWTAAQLGQKAVVLMPAGTATERRDNIRALGAQCDITEHRYDDCVRLAADLAEKNGWLLMQDTAWPGYEQIPTWIMQGYTTMALEAAEQLREQGRALPTHLFLQAGVGSMAGAIAGFYAELAQALGGPRPIVAVVEPLSADCFYRTALADDGKLHGVDGEMHTMMAGLACGQPCGPAWDLLRDHADLCIACPEHAAANGMRILGAPLGGDRRVISGESGASAFGCLAEIMRDAALGELRRELKLNETSQVLLFSTEGATDQENYWRVVWDGRCPGALA